MKNPKKALEAIEILVGGDMGFELENFLVDKKTNVDRDSLLFQSAKIITEIYCIAHSEGECEHPDWEELKYKIIKKYEEENY